MRPVERVTVLESVTGAPIVAPAPGLRQLARVKPVNPKDEIEAIGGQLDGAPVADGKPHRHLAEGDQPGHPTGCYLLRPDGEGFATAWHPHSTVIFHGQGRNKRGAR